MYVYRDRCMRLGTSFHSWRLLESNEKHAHCGIDRLVLFLWVGCATGVGTLIIYMFFILSIRERTRPQEYSQYVRVTKQNCHRWSVWVISHPLSHATLRMKRKRKNVESALTAELENTAGSTERIGERAFAARTVVCITGSFDVRSRSQVVMFLCL